MSVKISKQAVTALLAMGVLTLTCAPGFAARKGVQAANYIEPPVSQPIQVSALPPPKLSAASPTAKFQSIPTSNQLSPVSFFPVDKQYTTYITQFILSTNKNLSWEQANLMSQAIYELSHYYNVDFRLVAGVIAVESSFRTDAVSSSGAIGLGQLKPATAQWLGVGNPFDPIENIAGATRYLSYLLGRYNGNMDNALSAYYQGPGHVDRNGVTEVCQRYLQKINTALGRFY